MGIQSKLGIKKTIQPIYDDWISSCNHETSLDTVSDYISSYSLALADLKTKIKDSFLSKGFVLQNENLLTKVSIETEDGYKHPVVEFYPMSYNCTDNLFNLQIQVTIPGKEDSDGITSATFVEDNFELVGTQGMSTYETGKLKPSTIGFYDSERTGSLILKQAKVTRATCG